MSYQQLPNVVVNQGNGFRTATIVLLIIAAIVGVGMVVLLVTFSLAVFSLAGVDDSDGRLLRNNRAAQQVPPCSTPAICGCLLIRPPDRALRSGGDPNHD